MFNRMLSAFGIGGPSVDTVLDSPHAVPGQSVTGQVRVQGGSSDAEIGQVVLSLVTRVDRGGFSFGHDDERGDGTEFSRSVVQQDLRVPAGRLVSVPFRLVLPWETPITAVAGAALPGMSVGVRTELVIAGAPDKGDLDAVLVGPLPSQNEVLDAFGQLGFSFRGTGVETGHLPGVAHELGFFQELEFVPPGQFSGRVDQVELTFVATAHELRVILGADRRRGGFNSGGDTTGHLRVSHQEARATDWVSAIGAWLTRVAACSATNPAFGGGAPDPAFGGQPGHNPASGAPMGHGGQPVYGGQRAFGGQPGHGGHDHQQDQRRGAGMGGMLAAGAGGVLGGMALGGMADEFFGDDEG
ncbi:sporulation protein [Actinokineospora spheciospongiae]|uniref:sporulation protein n=1 Tax=Actinokineospora spheciospongiae TaxID=909613 RepID=UPI000D716F56|nr:sporulation protein [Actinokineospora spheciospongiae]PWW53730.1 sporulation-control protein [Actinokineospora spheciospongiae]